MSKEKYYLIDSEPYDEIQCFGNKTELNLYLSGIDLDGTAPDTFRVIYGKEYSIKMVLGGEL